MKHYSKQIIITAFALFLVTGVSVYAAATWRGTTSISQGTVIEAGIIKDNFDYLYERVRALEDASGGENTTTAYVNGSEDIYGSWRDRSGRNDLYYTTAAQQAENCEQTTDGYSPDPAVTYAYTCAPSDNKTCTDVRSLSGPVRQSRTVTCKRAVVQAEVLD